MTWFKSPSWQPAKLPIAFICQTLLFTGFFQHILKHTIIVTTIIICGLATHSKQLLYCTLLGSLKILSNP